MSGFAYGLQRHWANIHEDQLQPVKLGCPKVSGDATGTLPNVQGCAAFEMHSAF